MWEYLREEAYDHPDSPADVWYKDMLQTYGELANFPHVGCGSNYVPFKRGPSMVCEIQLRHGVGGWEAFLADHTPQALDDQLKKITYDALSRAFEQVSPETILKAIPMTMPMTHLALISGKRMEGIAKYPLDAWIRSGAPCFTTERWALMCLALAEKGLDSTKSDFSPEDMRVFDQLFTTASAMANLAAPTKTG